MPTRPDSRTLLLTCGALAALFAGSARAQRAGKLVLPEVYANAEGGSASPAPFGGRRPGRLQVWYAPRLLPARIVAVGAAFRPDGGPATPGKRVELELELSTGRAAAREVTQYFRMNKGLDATVCVARRRVALPAAPAARGPRPFSVRLAFDRPFAYRGVRGGLLLDLRVRSQSAGRYDLDMGAACVSDSRTFGWPGCRGSRGLRLQAGPGGAEVSWARSFELRVRGMAPGALGGILLGSRAGGSWNGLRLPHRLVREGAPACALNVDVLAATYGRATAAGELRLRYAMPYAPWLAGHWLHYQGVAIDRRANPLGVVSSAGVRTRVCDPFPIVQVAAEGADPVLGTVTLGRAPICELDVR